MFYVKKNQFYESQTKIADEWFLSSREETRKLTFLKPYFILYKS